MRRLDIINSVLNINKAISDSMLNEVIMAPLQGKERHDTELLINSLQKFSIHYQSFGENEKKILEIFGLEGLTNPKLWAKIISGEKIESRDYARPYYRGMSFMMEYLSKMIDLLKQDHVEYVKYDKDISINASNNENQGIITIILPERDAESSHPDRLIRILASINNFYNTASHLNDHKDNDLSVIAIDSGSDKSFDFLGAAKVVTAVKELIIELWDRVIFYREKKMHERIDLITKSLPIIEKINALENGGKIAREQAEIFRRNIIDGAKGFIECGALLPEFENHSSYSPRQLMAPEPKLLTIPDAIKETPPDEITQQDNIEVNKAEELNTTERELLKTLLERESKRKTRKKPNT